MLKTSIFSILAIFVTLSISANSNSSELKPKQLQPTVANIQSMIEGQIVFEVPLNSHVKTGQLVEQVDPRQYKANVLKDLASIDYYKQLYQADQRLVKSHSISYSEYLGAQYNYRNAVATYKYDKAILDHCNVYAPFDGTVTKVTTYPGSGIGDGSLILQITQDENVI